MKREENSNTTLVKVKLDKLHCESRSISNSNTTLVKVKYWLRDNGFEPYVNSNTTLVKVKYRRSTSTRNLKRIQIQLLLKLNIKN